MTSKINCVTKLCFRNIKLYTNLNGQTNRQLKVIKSPDLPKGARGLDVKAEKNRSIWEKGNESESMLKGKLCSDDVYFVDEYERRVYPFIDAVNNHKDYLLDRSMLDSPHSVLNAKFLLNMKTKKATKFISKLEGVVIPKHELHFLPRPKILAFCMTPEDIEIALASGAYKAGNEILIKKLGTGEINYEEFDQVVSHIDALPLLAKLKPILKEKFPMKNTRRVGDNMNLLVEKYFKGYEFESKKTEGIPEESHLTIPLGEIEWPIEHLVDNFHIFLNEIFSTSSLQIAGDPIKKVTLLCPPSDEIFAVDLSTYLDKLQNLKSKQTRSETSNNNL